MTWLVFYQGKPFSQPEAGAILWPPTKFSGCIVIPWMGDSFCAGLYLQFTAAFLYMCISGQRENRALVFVNSCMWSHTFISNWTLCFCGGYFILFFFYPCRENRWSLCNPFSKWNSWDITGLQSTLWLHSPGKKRLQNKYFMQHIKISNADWNILKV